MFGRKKIAMVVAEFLGTAVLTLAVLAVSKSTIGIPYFVSLAAGLAIAAGTVAFASVSGAQFNPAITIGLWSVRRMKTVPALVFIAAQLVGGAAAFKLYTYFIGQTWTNSGKFEGKILVAEAVGAFVFSLAWAVVAYRKMEDTKAAPIVGGGLILGILVASSAAAGFLNPAVALGARSWVWGTYVLGPVLGSVIGFNLYGLLFAPAKEVVAASDTAKAAVVASKTSKKKK